MNERERERDICAYFVHICMHTHTHTHTKRAVCVPLWGATGLSLLVIRCVSVNIAGDQSGEGGGARWPAWLGGPPTCH